MSEIRATLHWLIPYAISVVMTKGVALITIPLLTGYLSLTEYGSLELVASVIEIAALILSFSAADLLFRFTGTTDAKEARRNASAIAGGALALALLVGGFLQVALVFAKPYIESAIDVKLLAVGLLCASFSALIELPLAWLRSRGSARTFLMYVCARAFIQTGMMALTLSNGYGAFGVIAGNAAVDAFFSALLLWRQHKDTGISIDTRLLARAAHYGWPLLGGAVAMFILGNCDRWFLAGAVSKETLAHYALAAKLATIVALAMQPFGLWWNARRMRVLKEPEGDQRSAIAVSWGFACLTLGAIWVTIGLPPIVRATLPMAYVPAMDWLPWLVLIVAMNETSSLLNVSAYLGKTTTPALIVNGCAACVALMGYIFLAPSHGIFGAIIATIAGHALRIVCYACHGLRHAPIPYHWSRMATMAIIALATIQTSHMLETILAKAAILICATLLVAAVAFAKALETSLSPQAGAA